MIYVSTTYYKKKLSSLEKVLKELINLPIDGIEIGSTHCYQTKRNFKNILKKTNNKKIFIHNFFPPIKDRNFVINIASADKKIRNQSTDLIIENIDFCKSVGSDLYTFHPGFLSNSIPYTNYSKLDYDFKFSKIKTNYNLTFNNMISSLKKIISHSRKNKTKIAIETEGSITKKDFLIMQTPQEYENLFKIFPNDLYVNFNIAHSNFASKAFNFSMIKFLKKIKPKIAAAELSCNDGIHDQHSPLKKKSKNLNYLQYLNDRPIILEFRNANLSTLINSIKILRDNLKKYD